MLDVVIAGERTNLIWKSCPSRLRRGRIGCSFFGGVRVGSLNSDFISEGSYLSICFFFVALGVLP